MKYLISLFFAITLVFPKYGTSCSMYKSTKNGKTIVGNNEDWTSPNGQFWFEEATENTFGVMYMGFLDDFIQGAINDQALVFDGFWEPFLEVKNVAGKLEIPIGDALKKVMQQMTRVEEVKAYLETINLSILENGQLVFVDNTGAYLIVEGDKMFIGNEDEKSFSNFYYSQIESIDEVNLAYFQNGQKFIDATAQSNRLDYCGEAMQHFSQSNIAPTQYTTVYDLTSLTIRVYLFHDYTSYVDLDLKKELQKGNHKTMIADLFPKESIGYKYFEKYNDTAQPTQLLEERIGDQEITEHEFLSMGFHNIISGLAYEWLDDIKNPEAAIKVFSYGITLMPNNVDLHNGLGESYFVNKELEKAKAVYEKSLLLDPENKKALDKMLEIDQLRK